MNGGNGPLANEETTMTTTMQTAEITDTQIRTLRSEAAQAGDTAQVAICDRALTGDDSARAECACAIADAAAQGE